MRCSTLKDLPTPPENKTGWPWTQESLQLPDKMPNGNPWPKISIVTPNYNHGRFIEETIRSVLLQGYPNLEYIIIDGGSNDSSIDIIRRYEKWITYWVSEPDRGHPDATNKGFMHARGDIFCWLNSSDWFESGALKIIAEILPEGGYWVVGDCLVVDESYKVIGHYIPEVISTAAYWVEQFLKGSSVRLPQASAFWNKDVWLNIGSLNENFQYVFDHEFFFRVYRTFGRPIIINRTLSHFRWHRDSKTCAAFMKVTSENLQVGIENRHILPLLKQLKTPFFIVRTRGRLKLYEVLELNKGAKDTRIILCLLKALLNHPILLLDRMFLGFIYQKILKPHLRIPAWLLSKFTGLY